jgi:exonuclease SbcD
MRLLHTSDWHLGRSFHREDLLGAQARFVDFLVDTVRAERVDAVLVSGDVYDRALPSVDAVALCNDALRRLAAAGTRVVLISGNHDSARRLGFGADLIDAAGIHLRTDPAAVGRPVLLDHADGAVAVYALP